MANLIKEEITNHNPGLYGLFFNNAAHCLATAVRSPWPVIIDYEWTTVNCSTAPTASHP
jgi:hypothetical protein